MKKIFISSVMNGFESERGAARTAVESLRLVPVMAEDFGAKPHSSKIACVEGVRGSDAYVGLLGPRYGSVTNSGLSVTEEEFNTARGNGLPIFIFVQRASLEADQQAFYKRISGYEQGYFVAFFRTAQDLQKEVTRALHDHFSQPDVRKVTSGGAGEMMTAHLKKNDQRHEVEMGAFVLPERQGEEYIPVLEMGTKEYKDTVLQPALFGDSAIFSTSLGVQNIDGREHMRFEQRGQHHQTFPIAAVEFHSNGLVAWSSAISGKVNDFSLKSQFIIDRDNVEQRLSAFLFYAKAFYGGLSASPLISSLFLWTYLRNLNQKYLGRWSEANTKGGMSMPMDSIEDPLMIPAQPLRISRAELGKPRQLATKVMGLVERAFRAEDRYFDESKSRGW